jgi:hypothetical protein
MPLTGGTSFVALARPHRLMNYCSDTGPCRLRITGTARLGAPVRTDGLVLHEPGASSAVLRAGPAAALVMQIRAVVACTVRWRGW